jgi:hypothetical protein
LLEYPKLWAVAAYVSEIVVITRPTSPGQTTSAILMDGLAN